MPPTSLRGLLKCVTSLVAIKHNKSCLEINTQLTQIRKQYTPWRQDYSFDHVDAS